MSTYDFSTHYDTLPQNIFKDKLTELSEHAFNREGSLYLACNANGFKLYRHNIGTPMDTNCVSPVADLVLFCYEIHHAVPNI